MNLSSVHPLDLVAREVGGRAALAIALGVTTAALGNWKVRGVPVERCVGIERLGNGLVTRRDLRPNDWHDIWPEHEEAERLRAVVADLLQRLRRYEPDAADVQAPAAINSEALHSGQEVAHV